MLSTQTEMCSCSGRLAPSTRRLESHLGPRAILRLASAKLVRSTEVWKAESYLGPSIRSPISDKPKTHAYLPYFTLGAMTGADMAVGYRNPNGTFVIENRHASGFVTPEVSSDQTINMQFVEGDQSNGVTYLIFNKKNTVNCLDTQTDVHNDSWQWFIYAYSNSNTFAQHAEGHMGKQYLKLGTGTDVALNRATNVENSQNFTVIQPEVTVPTDVTTYCYTLHKMPAGNKNFLVGERPNKASDLLHHQVIYACYDLPDEYLGMVGKEANCDWQSFSNPCNGFVAEWAPGMSARTFEPGYGKPFGEDSYEYVMLEIHYNNPEQLQNIKDTASFTFLWTDQQVDTEIGTLTLGDLQVEGWSLEPGKELVSHSTVCTPNCTSNWPTEGITAVAVFHHMHYRGVNTQVQIIRDGKEITPLSSLRNFEYGYQFSKSLNNIKLLPGDRLITTCQYNTLNDTEPVPGGLPSQAEMCFAWVDYYPANGVFACTQFDLGNDPLNPVNGSVGVCLDSSKNEPEIYGASSLISEYESLPAIGNNCTNSDTGTQIGASILQTCPENDVCFSLAIPESSAASGSGDIFFQLSAPTTYSWIALAQGTMMRNANMFVMHSSADGQNVTLSPRTTSGHVMPTYNAAANITLLEGSGISDGMMTANVRCSNCETWSTGTMGLNDGSSDWVYAGLQGPPIASDALEAPISQHDDHGSFQWDLSKAVGGSSTNPFLASNSSTTSSSSSTSEDHRHNRLIQAHGSLASIVFIAIFPLGAILVRLASFTNLAWIHGILQLCGYAIFIAAAGLGIHLARADEYLQKPHAIIGMLLLGVLFFMPILGAVHHKIYQKVSNRTIWAYGNIITGRVAIVLGMINGGLGLQLADAARSYRVVYGVFAAMMAVLYLGAVVFGELRRARTKGRGDVAGLTPADPKDREVMSGKRDSETSSGSLRGGLAPATVSLSRSF